MKTQKDKLGIVNQKIVSCPDSKRCRVFELKENILCKGWAIMYGHQGNLLFDVIDEHEAKESYLDRSIRNLRAIGHESRKVRVKVVEE